MAGKKTVELKIEKMNLGAQGIGYIEGKVCFVDFAIPGEKIKAEIITKKNDYNVAKCIEIIQPSPYRVEPRCPVFLVCGGCQLQHVDYQFQVQLKKEILIDTLRRIGKIEWNDIEVITDQPWHYRNRAQLRIQNKTDIKIGYFKKNTHEVVNQNICYINEIEINQALTIIRKRIEGSKIKVYSEIDHSGNLRHIILRRGTNTGQLYIIFVTKDRQIPYALYENLIDVIPGVVGISQNINAQKTNRIIGDKNITLAGTHFYEETIDNKLFRISPTSFFQVNTGIFEKIIEKIKSQITGSIIVDLYAGVGVIGISLAPICERVIAIEENPFAVNDGIVNAQINNIENIEFLQGRVEKLINNLTTGDTLILDPPRKGVAKAVFEILSRIKIKKIIYLSCNPATLARDAVLILNSGYTIKKTYLFDMFPQTYHIETLMIFEKTCV
ncbi:MAG: 23S rRNA (uracil(1939)-C(5))-methyltransferase RlmD [bacterium]